MVKWLGVSIFTDKEINFFQEMGNNNVKEIWRAKFNPDKHKLPFATNENSLKSIKLKYTEKKWYKKSPNDEEEDKKHSKKKKHESSDDEEEIKPSTLKKSNKNIVMVSIDKKKPDSSQFLNNRT